MPPSFGAKAITSLAEICERIPDRLEQADVDKLATMLDQGVGTWNYRPSPEHIVAASLIDEIIDRASASSPLVTPIVRLAEQAEVDAAPLFKRLVKEGRWHEVEEIIADVEGDWMSIVAECFCESATPDCARMIVMTGEIHDHIDLSKQTFAGQDSCALFGSLADALGNGEVRGYLLPILESDPDELLAALDIISPYATAADEDLLIAAISKRIDRLNEELGELQNSYGRSNEQEGIEQRITDCLDWIRESSCCATASRILAVMTPLAGMPLHNHRELRDRAQDLAGLLDEILPARSKLLSSMLPVLPIARIHPAALRYATRIMSQRSIDALLLVTEGKISAVADTISRQDRSSSGPIFDDDGTLREAYDPDARIWPRNHAVVSQLFAPLEQSRLRFAELVTQEWHRDEDSLSDRLCTYLLDSLESWSRSRDVQRWIRDRYKYGRLLISEPYVRDLEPTWGADIGIIVNYDVEDTLRHCWGYLLQAKKAFIGERGPTRWDIDRDQLEDLMLRTDACYYLLYTPSDDVVAPFVLPGKVVLSTLEAIENHPKRTKATARSIPFAAGRDLSKSWTSFLLEDVVGCWTGDSDGRMIEAMRRGEAARVVFEITIALGAAQG